MLFQNHMGKDFDNLGQRMVYVSAVQLSPLKTIATKIADKEDQTELHSFISDFYKTIFDNPSLIGIDEFPDECENNTYGGKPYLETRKLMRKVQKKITDVFDWLVLYGKNGYVEEYTLIVNKSDVRITKKKIAILRNIGILVNDNGDSFSLSSDKYPGMMKALVYVAGISPEKKAHIYLFRGIFDPEYNYYPAMFREHCTSSDVFNKVMKYCKENDFTEQFRIMDTDFGRTYWFVKEHNDMELKFLCQYDPRYYYQLCFTFVDDKRVFRWVLENFSSFDKNIQDLFFEKNKKCNRCGYCNQTNKNRPLAFITVNYEGKEYELCPYFQHLRCYFLDAEYVDRVLYFFKYVLSL